MGPHVLGLVGDAEGKIGIAELGIVLMLFVVGLELASARLWRLRHSIFQFGTSQVSGLFAHPANPRSSRACRGMPREI